jgi:uncharacterized protein YunC (DUF1805 family)
MDLAGLETHHVALQPPLLMVKGRRGVVGSGYLSVETFNKTREAAAIVTGARTFGDMASASVVKVSLAGKQLGLRVGMTGAQALAVVR